MTASTLSAAAKAGGAVADGGGWTALADGGGAGDVGEVDAEGVSVMRGVACGDGATTCGDETTVWGGLARIDVEAALPVAICTAIIATARITTPAATARYARRGAQARGRARWRGT
jgi:hypothetical protein